MDKSDFFLAAQRFDELKEAVLPFFPKMQLKIISDAIADFNNEDWASTKDYYLGILKRFKNTFANMPKTYETEPPEPEEDAGSTDQPDRGDVIVHLHYFVGNCDWWIIEKDKCEEQNQAYGFVDLGHGPEFGYISLVELTDLHGKTNQGLPYAVELDFHWEPKKLKDIPELAQLFCNDD